MSYTLDTSQTSPNFTAGPDVLSAFGYPRNIIGCTIHHWDGKYSGATWAGTHGTLMNPYWNPGARGVSAHFQIESGRAACLVFPGDAAWHAGNPKGNAQTIGLELNPDESNGTYQTTAEVLALIWSQWDIPHTLFPHNFWTGTDCPGGYDLARLRNMAEAEYAKLLRAQGGGITPIPPKPAPVPPKPAPAPVVKRKTYSMDDIHWNVEKGDTLSKISRYYLGDNTAPSLQRIADYNGIAVNSVLKVGDNIWIPGPLYWNIAHVEDELVTIAAYYGLDADYLARLNGLPNKWATIYLGNRLTIKE